MPIIDPHLLAVSPAIRKLIADELTIRLCQPQVEPEELTDFIDYLLLANCGLEDFRLTDQQIAAMQLEPDNNEELRQSLED